VQNTVTSGDTAVFGAVFLHSAPHTHTFGAPARSLWAGVATRLQAFFGTRLRRPRSALTHGAAHVQSTVSVSVYVRACLHVRAIQNSWACPWLRPHPTSCRLRATASGLGPGPLAPVSVVGCGGRRAGRARTAPMGEHDPCSAHLPVPPPLSTTTTKTTL
jgi:hypothetical protein